MRPFSIGSDAPARPISDAARSSGGRCPRAPHGATPLRTRSRSFLLAPRSRRRRSTSASGVRWAGRLGAGGGVGVPSRRRVCASSRRALQGVPRSGDLGRHRQGHRGGAGRLIDLGLLIDHEGLRSGKEARVEQRASHGARRRGAGSGRSARDAPGAAAASAALVMDSLMTGSIYATGGVRRAGGARAPACARQRPCRRRAQDDLVEGEDGDLGEGRADELRQEAAHVGADEHDDVLAGLRRRRDRGGDLVDELGEVGGADGGLLRPTLATDGRGEDASIVGSRVIAWTVPVPSPNCSQSARPSRCRQEAR